MQLMIDLSVPNDAATLRVIAAMLVEVANKSGPDVPSGTRNPLDAPTSSAPVALPSLGVVVIPPPPVAIIPPPPPAVSSTPSAPAAPVIPAPPTVAAVASPAANVELDKRGYPYDERIHSGTPTINKSDGLWRTKRGVDNALLEAVESELRDKGFGVVNAAPVIPPPPVSLPPVVIPPPPPVVAAPNAAAAQPSVMVPPPPPVADGLLPGNGAGEVDLFRVLMNKVGGHTGPDGKLRREVMLPIYTALGVDGLPAMYHKRDKIPALLAEIDKLLGV